MALLRAFYPYERAESVFALDYGRLYALGFRGVVFDLDGTLVPHGWDATPAVERLFRDLHAAGLKTLVLSNNNEARVLRFLKNIGGPYVCDAEKPDPAGFRRAAELLALPAEQILFVGDQVFTDIYGANRCGYPSLLVNYILRPGETKLGIRRRLEKLVLWFFSHSRFQHRLGNTERKGV